MMLDIRDFTQALGNYGNMTINKLKFLSSSLTRSIDNVSTWPCIVERSCVRNHQYGPLELSMVCATAHKSEFGHLKLYVLRLQMIQMVQRGHRWHLYRGFHLISAALFFYLQNSVLQRLSQC